MIFDATLIFSDEQAITADAASTNVVDLGATGTPYGGNALTRDIGKGTKVPLYLYVTETFNNLTSLNIVLQKDTVEGFGSAETVWSHNVVAADLVAGSRIALPDYIPEGADQRYLRFNYDVVGTNPSTGKITAGVVAARQSNMGDHY